MSDRTFTVLFICSGNSCRSAMAEGLLKSKIQEELRDRVQVLSAGTLGINGASATQYAVQVTRELGGDIENHVSQGVTGELVRRADVILAMAKEHKNFLGANYPQVRDNVFLLRAFDTGSGDRESKDVDDPIGGSLDVYRGCGDVINSELDRIWPRLVSLINAKYESGN